MAVPALMLFCTFFVYPLALGLGMSLTDWEKPLMPWISMPESSKRRRTAR